METSDLQYYTTIELLIKTGGESTNKLSFDDCSFILSGNFIIIITKKDDTNKKINTIFNLNDIKAFKTTQ